MIIKRKAPVVRLGLVDMDNFHMSDEDSRRKLSTAGGPQWVGVTHVLAEVGVNTSHTLEGVGLEKPREAGDIHQCTVLYHFPWLW